MAIWYYLPSVDEAGRLIYHTRAAGSDWTGPYFLDAVTGQSPWTHRSQVFAGPASLHLMYATGEADQRLELRRHIGGDAWEGPVVLHTIAAGAPNYPSFFPWHLAQGPGGEQMAFWLVARVFGTETQVNTLWSSYYRPGAGWSEPLEAPVGLGSPRAIQMQGDGTVLTASSGGVWRYVPTTGWEKLAEVPVPMGASAAYAIDARGRVTAAWTTAGQSSSQVYVSTYGR